MATPEKRPHLVFFPFPAQGHVTPAFHLASLLHHFHGFDVTFVHTEHNRRRLLRACGADALAGSPGFSFVAVPDGLPRSDEDAAQDMTALLLSLPTMVPHFKKLVLSGLHTSAASCCLISDVEPILRAAKEICLPCVTFWTSSASALMAYHQFPQLAAKGLAPLKDAEQLKNGYLESTVVDWVPGMPKMRLKDFPSFMRTTDPDDVVFALTLSLEECYRTVPSAVIFHTFDELESQVIRVMSAILPPIYAIGPLPLLLRQAAGDGPAAVVDTSDSSLSKENRACLDWLDGKRANSVVFVSFGSIVKLANEQLVELAWGLANSGYDFLWVIRSDQQQPVLPPEFLAETEGRGCVTSWCPQQAVLRHEAVGAFLTHCGWNSMLESVSAGVPVLCWPGAADQQTNSWLACTQWRLGVDIGEDPRREDVELAIRQVMGGDDKGEELRRSATEWKEKAALATRPGGSSWVNLERLVNEVLTPLMHKP